MIELVSAERCTGCNICVAVCPTRVFDAGAPGAAPQIARGDDCQTCFMCELYCPADALYVAPHCGSHPPMHEADLASAGLLGSYRSAIGWAVPGQGHPAHHDRSYELLGRVRPAAALPTANNHPPQSQPVSTTHERPV